MNAYLILFYWICLSNGTSKILREDLDLFPRSSNYVFAQARCSARCSTQYDTKSTEANNTNIPCSVKSTRCKVCNEVCFSMLVSDLRRSCHQICEYVDSINFDVCFDSCTFINGVIKGLKSGSCPAENCGIAPLDDVMKECSNDWECTVDEKCCPYERNRKYLCKSAVHLKQENLVDVTISELKPTSCKLTWKLTNHQRKEGVHYVIEKRYSIKTPLSDDQFSFWEYEGQTPLVQYMLTNLHLSHYYQFRIAVVKTTGYHGYSKTNVVKLPMSFHIPPSPIHFRIRNITKNFEDNTVDVELSWKPPNVTVGKMLNYNMELYKTLPKHNLTAFTIVNKMNIPTTQSSLLLRHLNPDTSYTAVIFVVVFMGTTVSIESKGQKLVFVTRTTVQSKNDIIQSGEQNSKISGITNEENDRKSTEMEMSAYITGIVKNGSFVDVHIAWKKFSDTNINSVKISWQGNECREISSSSSHAIGRVLFTFVRSELLKYTLTGLERHCHYHIELEPYYHYGVKAKRMLFQIDTVFDESEDGAFWTSSTKNFSSFISTNIFVIAIISIMIYMYL